jgi:dTDP-4-dehydrorhamnose reductase
MAKEGKALRVVNDQVMVPTHSLDVAKAVAAFITKDVRDYGVYHCTSHGQCSWFEFTKAILELAGVSADLTGVESSAYKTAAKRPHYSVMSNEKLSRFYPMPRWDSTLAEYLRLKGHIGRS